MTEASEKLYPPLMKIKNLHYTSSGIEQTIPFGSRVTSGPSLRAPLDSFADLVSGIIPPRWQLAIDAGECPTLRVELDSENLTCVRPEECPVGKGMISWNNAGPVQVVFDHIKTPEGWAPMSYWNVMDPGHDTLFTPYQSCHARLLNVKHPTAGMSQVATAVVEELAYMAELVGMSLRAPTATNANEAWRRALSQLGYHDRIARAVASKAISAGKIVDEWVIGRGRIGCDLPHLVSQLDKDHLGLLLICLGCASSQLSGDLVHPNRRGVHFIVEASDQSYVDFISKLLDEDVNHAASDASFMLLDS